MSLHQWKEKLAAWGAFHWSFVFMMGVLSTILGFSIAIAGMIWFVPVFRHPLAISLVDTGINGPVCPGDTIDSTVEIIEEGNLIMNVFWGFAVDEEQAALGTFIGSVYTLPGEESSVLRVFPWTVPDFSPGNYRAIRAYYMLGEGLEPEHIEIPFTIAEGCKREE